LGRKRLRGIIIEKYFLVGGVKADFASLEESFGQKFNRNADAVDQSLWRRTMTRIERIYIGVYDKAPEILCVSLRPGAFPHRGLRAVKLLCEYSAFSCSLPAGRQVCGESPQLQDPF